MSEMATEIQEGADYAAPEAGAEEAWSGPTQEEWQSLRDGVGAVTEMWNGLQANAEQELAQQQAAEYQEALTAALDPLSEEYDPALVMELVRREAARQMSPILDYVNQRQQADDLAYTEDLVADILEDAGVAEESLQAAYEAAEELYPQYREEYARQYDHLYQQILRQYGKEEAARWVKESQVIIAEAALQRAASQFNGSNDRPESLRDIARRFQSGQPRDERGRFASERPDSLRDIARRYS